MGARDSKDPYRTINLRSSTIQEIKDEAIPFYLKQYPEHKHIVTMDYIVRRMIAKYVGRL